MKSTRALREGDLVDVDAHVLPVAGAVLAGDDLALRRDDPAQRRLVLEDEVAQGQKAGLRPLARRELQDEIAARHAAIDVEEAQHAAGIGHFEEDQRNAAAGHGLRGQIARSEPPLDVELADRVLADRGLHRRRS